jgi:DNA mismatch repair ATPase MutS
VSKELQDLIEKEELVRDAMKLQKYRCNSKIIKLIDNIKHELADTTDIMGELDYIYKFAEMLKEELE